MVAIEHCFSSYNVAFVSYTDGKTQLYFQFQSHFCTAASMIVLQKLGNVHTSFMHHVIQTAG